MEKNNELIAFFKSLPDESTRIFENAVVKYATMNATSDDEKNLEELINTCQDSKVSYAAFYCLNAMLRRKKDFYKMQENFEKYPQYKNHITYNHLWLMYQIEAELFYDYDDILKMAYELTEQLPEHSGIVHLLPATYVSIMENCDEESRKNLLSKWFEKSLYCANKAIKLEPDYAKFYCTKAQVLATNNDFSETSLLIHRAIALEDSSRKDYALRVSTYQYTELLIKITEQQFYFDKKLGQYKGLNKITKNELEKPRAVITDLPFIFVSYAHANQDVVFPLIEKIKTWGYRVWYDEGIAFGTEYNEYIADKIVKCSQVVLFVSNAAVKSNYVRKEINFAIASGKDPLLVYIEETFLTTGMKMQLENNQAISWYQMDESLFENKIRETLVVDTNEMIKNPKLKVIEHVCEPGGSNPNEDYFYQDEYSVFVLDGSTNLVKNSNGINAEWYVNSFGEEFKKQDACLDLKTILKRTVLSMKQKVINDFEGSYDFDNNLVCASFAGIHLHQGRLEVATLSDCTVCVHLKNGDTITNTVHGGLRLLDKKVLEKANQMRKEYNLSMIDVLRNPEIQKMIIDNRLKMNKSDDYWSMAFSTEALEHIAYTILDIEKIDAILIYSDGFDQMKQKMLDSFPISLHDLYTELRATENKDNKCNEYLRFKISDDATIALILVDYR